MMGDPRLFNRAIRESQKIQYNIMLSEYYPAGPGDPVRKPSKASRAHYKQRVVESVPRLLNNIKTTNAIELSRKPVVKRSYKVSIRKPVTVHSSAHRSSENTGVVMKKPKYLYCVGPYNNPDICMNALKARSWWGPAPNQHSVNFFWLARFNVPYSLFDGGRQTRLINRFEKYFEIHEKDNVFRNLWFQCNDSGKQVFEYMPLSFSFRANERSFFNDLQSFARTFRSLEEKKDPRDVKPKVQILDKYGASHDIFYQYSGFFVPDRRSIPNEKLLFQNISTEGGKLPIPKCFDCGKNLWILKPSWMSRGRGIEIFGSLKELDKLLSKYLEGYEAKDYSHLNYSDKTEKSPVVNNQDEKDYPDSYKKFMDKYRPGKVSTFPVFVIQKYIERPFLFKGFKFDIRMYGCLTHEYEVYTFQ